MDVEKEQTTLVEARHLMVGDRVQIMDRYRLVTAVDKTGAARSYGHATGYIHVTATYEDDGEVHTRPYRPDARLTVTHAGGEPRELYYLKARSDGVALWWNGSMYAPKVEQAIPFGRLEAQRRCVDSCHMVSAWPAGYVDEVATRCVDPSDLSSERRLVAPNA